MTIKRQNRTYRRLAQGYRLPGGFRRIYCYHVRKTGGTSLHRSFMALGGEDPADVHQRLAASPGNRTSSNGLAYVAHSSELLREGAYFYGWSHHPAHELGLPAATFTVAILRDPVQRVCSHYQMLVHGTRGSYPFPHTREEAELAARGFDPFVESLPREELLRQLFMFSATFDVDDALERLSECSHVFFSEEYEAGLAELTQRLDVPLVMRRERRSAGQVELPPESLDTLRGLLEPEYELIDRVRRGRVSAAAP